MSDAAVIAVYSLKGGVGKSTLAVNLAWAAAQLSARRTLLWDLDGQGAATWLMGVDVHAGSDAAAAIRREIKLQKLIRPTAIERIDLVPADASLHGLDITFREMDKRKRLAKLADTIGGGYDRVIIDCPPGLTDTSDQVLRAADVVVVPVIPAPLAERALAALEAHLGARKGSAARLLPVFSMVDRRRTLHRDALAAEPDWPVVPMASAFETMARRRAPLGAFEPRRAKGVEAVAAVWRQVEAMLAD